jgi:hypothetical protein
MAMSVQILDKIQRNCQQRGLSVSRPSADLLIAEGIEISYEDAAVLSPATSPMMGIDSSVSPFLGIGVANPGKIVLDTDPASIAEFQVLRIVCGHANTVVIPAGELPGHADLNGMGQ